MVFFDLPPGIKEQDNKAFAIWIEVRMTWHMSFPTLRCLPWPFTDLHFLRRWTFS